MSKLNLSVLLAEDDDAHRKTLALLLAEWGYDIIEARDGAEAVKIALGSRAPDLILMDARMPVMDGIKALEEIKKIRPEIPIILITAYSDIPDAVESIRKGALDYLTKPPDFQKLEKIIKDAAAGVSGEIDFIAQGESWRGMIGSSEPMLKTRALIEKLAPTEATVLIGGESGTGKELIARALHAAGRRAQAPFVAINCGAFTESLLASELFGHEKGAFTGADKKRPGLFLEAGDGTVFLDEIGETPPAMQVKLLRVLQEKEITPVGSSRVARVKCRIIAATNRDLEEDVKKGVFREDLYYRLNVANIRAPALRERKEDIPALARAFAQKFAAANHKKFKEVTGEALAILKKWSWPGNVRELENTLERAIILMNGEYVGARELPDRMRDVEPDSFMSRDLPEEAFSLAEMERKIIMRALDKMKGNKTETAKVLGITRKTLHAKLNRYKTEGE